MKVIIVGAGIGGLAAGIALRRKGHDVQIYERSGLLREIGAAINVCPNASHILIKWGFDTKRARMVTARRFINALGKTFEGQAAVTHPDYSKVFHGPWLLAHRVDLHSELRRVATDPEGLGKPVELHLRSDVIDYHSKEGQIVMADGSTRSADLVIAAEGVHSSAVHHVVGHDTPVVRTGWAVFRFLITSDDLRNDPEIAPLLHDGATELGDGLSRLLTVEGSMRRIVWYPCADNTIQNFVAIFEDDTTDGDGDEREDWDRSATVDDVLSKYEDFHPDILKVVRKATSIKRWPLLFRDPIPTFSKDRLVLIGDAAHPMLPHQGQGGAQAIEDAAALGELFADFKDNPPADEIRRRLKIFDKVRVRRASSIQWLSDAGQDRVAAVHDQVKKYMPEGVEVPRSPQEFFGYMFNYDAIADTQAHLQEYFESRA